MKRLSFFFQLIIALLAIASPQAMAADDTELADGYYYIKSGNPNLATAKVIAEGSGNALSPIDAPSDGSIDYTAIWKVAKADDGTYTLQNIRTGNYITAQTTKNAAYTTSATAYGFTIAYTLQQDEENYYRIYNSSDWETNTTTTYCLFMPDEGLNIKAYRGSSSTDALTRQDWTFVSLTLTDAQASAAYKAPADGYYYLRSGNPNFSTNKVISEGKSNALSTIDEPTDGNLYWGAVWKVVNTGDGTFSIQNLKTGNYITVQTTKNSAYATGTTAYGYSIAYKFTTDGTDYYRIWNDTDWESNEATYCFCAPASSTAINAFRPGSLTNTTCTQNEWTLVPLSLTDAQVAAGTAPLTGLSGIYRITSAVGSGAVLKETFSGKVKCAASSSSDTDLPELWRITASGTAGYYTIQNVATDKYISNAAAANQQYTTSTTASTFYIEGSLESGGIQYVNIWKNAYKKFDIINDTDNAQAIAKGVSSAGTSLTAGEWTLTPVTLDDETLTAAKARLNLSGIYNIKSVLGSYYIQESTSNALYRASSVSDTDYSTRWVLAITDWGQYTIQNVTTGNYLQVGENNKVMTTGQTPYSFAVAYLYDSSGASYFSVSNSSSSTLHLNVNTNQTSVFSWNGSVGTASSHSGFDFTFVSTEMTDEEVLAARASYYGVVSAIEDGKTYRIYNPTRNHYLTVNGYGSSCALQHNSKQTTDYLSYAQYWKATAVSGTDNGFIFTNIYTGKNWSSTQQSPYIVADEGSTFYVVANTAVPLMPVFNIKQSTSATSVPHAQESGSTVVNWEMGTSKITASEWMFEEVTLTDDNIALAQADYQEKLNILNNADSYEASLAKYFTDKACTTLNDTYASYSDDALTTAMTEDGLSTDLQNMVLKIKNNSWASYEKEFRIADYEAYSDPSYWSSTGLGFGYQMCHIESPTGIYAKKGDFLYIFVGEDDIPTGKALYLENVGSGSVNGTKTKLTVGTNVICADQTGSLFINYHDNTGTGDAELSSENNRTIHIEGGTLNGYFDVREETADGHRGHTNADFAAMKAAGLFSAPLLDMRSRNLVFHHGATALLKAFEDDKTYWNDGSYKIVEMLGVWDKILDEEDSICGINDKYIDGYSTHCNNIWSVCSPGSSYMHASTYGTYYNESTLTVFEYRYIKKNGGSLWGPAHENGHCHQNLINIIGDTEVSNNLFSNACVWLRGYTTTRGEDLDATFSNYAKGNFYLDYAERLRMYWQLYLYYEVLGKHPNFFPELFKELRSDRMVRTTGRVVKGSENYLKFAKLCCKVSGDDLTEFFKAWGFFVPITNYAVDDYGSYTLTTTQDEIDETLEYMADFNKGAENIIFIEDRITAPAAEYLAAADGQTTRTSYSNEWTIGYARGDVGQYTDYDDEANVKASGYLYTVSADGNSITMDASATGAVGYKIYDSEGNLVMLSNKDTINVSTLSGFPTGYTVYAAQADGTSVEAPNAASTDNKTLTAYYGTEGKTAKLYYASSSSFAPSFTTPNTVIINDDSSAPTSVTSATHVLTKVNNAYTTQSFTLTDKADFYSPVDFTATALTYKRENTAGYNSVCLPFATTASDYGEGAKIYSTSEVSEENGVSYVYITTQDEATAGTPVLIYCPNDVTDWSITKENAAVVSQPVENTNGATTLLGSYTNQTIGAGYYKLNSSGTAFGITTDAGIVKPFRSYMKSGSSGSALRLFVRTDSVTTAIGSASASSQDEGVWYDLQGRKVLRPANGIYIRGGRKVIIRSSFGFTVKP